MGEDAIIVAIVFGSILGMIAIPMLFNLAKKWIDRNSSSYDEEAFNRLAKAFISHKKDSDRRLQNLEAIVTDEEPASSSVSSSKQTLNKPRPHNTIEVDSGESESKTENKQNKSDDGNLRNMLKE